MCFTSMIANIVLLKHTKSDVVGIIGTVTIVSICISAILILPCHSDERMWIHSHWRCYPQYQPMMPI